MNANQSARPRNSAILQTGLWAAVLLMVACGEDPAPTQSGDPCEQRCLPFEVCKRSGHLFPRGNFGDNEELDAQGGTDCSGDISRRSPGSLLLFPEFDNRNGVATVFTVTNTDAQAGTDVHFVYLGRYGN